MSAQGRSRPERPGCSLARQHLPPDPVGRSDSQSFGLSSIRADPRGDRLGAWGEPLFGMGRHYAGLSFFSFD
jgi:hypothetical protein